MSWWDKVDLGEREIFKINGKYYYKCKNCGKIKYIRPADLKREGTRGYFCSRKCRAEYLGRRVKTKCAYCGKVIWVKKSEFEKWKTHYCSEECYNKAKSMLRRPIKLDPSPELAYVLGVCLGDGCVGSYKLGKDKRSSYRIILSVEHKEFAESFKNALEKIGLDPSMFLRESSRPNEKPLWWVVAYSKVFVEWYKEITSDMNKLYEFLKKCPRGFEEFIRGFYESEGSYFEKVYIRRWKQHVKHLHMFNTNKKLVDLVVSILRELGFSPYVSIEKREKYGWKDKYIIALPPKEHKRFFDLIKPVIKQPKK